MLVVFGETAVSGQVEQADEVLIRYRKLLVKESEMQGAREPAIRERAYALWEQDGRAEGKDLEHWQRAEAEILGEPMPASPTTANLWDVL